MISLLSESGRATAIVLVGLVVFVIPAGLAFANGLTNASQATQADGANTTTLPPLNLTETSSPTTTQTSTSSPTTTPPPTATQTPTPRPTAPEENESTERQILLVDDDSDLPTADCPEANYSLIQSAVEDAEPDDTVSVCAGTYSETVTVTTGNLTLSARGDVTIVTIGQPALWTNAAEVTIEGFEVRSRQHTGPAITIGGAEPLVRDNTVRSPNGTGIFLSDGLTKQGEPDPQLNGAPRGRIVDNTVTAYDYRIWSDADRTIIRNNSVTDLKTVTDSERQACSDGREGCESGNSSIISSGNGSLIQGNTVRYTNHPPALWDPNGTAIIVGGGDSQNPIGRGNSHNVSNRSVHNRGYQNVVVNNTVTGAPRAAVDLLQGAKGSVVRNNTFTDNIQGIRVWANDSVVRNNYVSRANYIPFRGVTVAGEAKIINNTITNYNQGLVVAGHAEIIRNTITDNLYMGVFFEDHNTEYFNINGTGVVLNNTIARNGRAGIAIDPLNNRSKIEIHYNRIYDNGALGISSKNPDKTDGFWPIVDATHNFWGCGGPSSGGGTTTLKDPYTGRLANGSGDAISAGDEPGMANVHFDPFYVREDLTCPASESNPTPTPTPTATSTPTPSQVPGGRSGNGSDGTDSGSDSGGPGDGATGRGNGNESGSGISTGPSESGSGSTATANPRPPTAQPAASPRATSTASPTPTLSPTPVVDPGFGVLTGVLASVLLGGLLILRRRVTIDTESDQ